MKEIKWFKIKELDNKYEISTEKKIRKVDNQALSIIYPNKTIIGWIPIKLNGDYLEISVDLIYYKYILNKNVKSILKKDYFKEVHNLIINKGD